MTDDDLGYTYEEWHLEWIADGMPWRSVREQPRLWDPAAQLNRLAKPTSTSIGSELGLEFLEREDLALSLDDLKYGFERGWLRASTVVDSAVREVRRGDRDPILLEVASLLRDDLDQLPDVLAQLDFPEHIHDPREAARKWLYLKLKAAYDRRQDLDDPLGTGEEIYANFDYPPTVESFVRYMPLRPGDDAGESALLKRWSAFLGSEHEALRAQAP